METIQAFKHALDHPSDDDLEDDLAVITTNHGNKLKRSARHVSSRSIAMPSENLGVKIVDYNGTKQQVLLDKDSEALQDIDLGAILRPITDPAQVPQHPSISRTFESSNLVDMAKETLDIIVVEKKNATRISNLLSAFLGDDPRNLLLENLDVPEASDAASFFAPPVQSSDRSFGVTEESAEEARQLLQIAHQRMEEFVQCMTQIRMGLLHANRKKRRVYNWCKEMNGQDYIEEETGGTEETAPPAWSALTDFQQDVSASMTERSD